MRAVAALSAALLLTAAAPPRPGPPAPEGGGWNRARIESMTPEAVTRALFGDAAGIMYLEAIQGIHPMRRRLSGLLPDLPWLRFLTEPRASRHPGICETERITVEFARLSGDLALSNKGRIRRLRVDDPLYFVADGKRLRRDDDFAQDEEATLDAACAGTDPRKARLIYSDSGHRVSSGFRLLERLMGAARRGRSPVPLTCSGEVSAQKKDEKACLAEVVAIRPEEVYSIATADGCGMGERGVYCTIVSLHDVSARETVITFRFTAGTTTPLSIEVFHPPSLEAIM